VASGDWEEASGEWLVASRELGGVVIEGNVNRCGGVGKNLQLCGYEYPDQAPQLDG